MTATAEAPVALWAPGHYAVPVDEITIGHRHREYIPEKAEALRPSIRLVGLLHPITVRTNRQLVIGRHRLEAVRLEGQATIMAEVRDMTDLEAELAQLDENLGRADLDFLQQSEHLLRRREILEEMGVTFAVRGDNRHTLAVDPNRDSGLLTNLDVASIIGLHNDRSVQQRFAIARMPEQVRAMVRHTPISRKLTELTALAEMKDPLQQMAVAEKIAVGEATSVNQVLGREFKDRNTDRTPAERRDGTVRATLTLEFDLPTPVHRARTGKHGDERAARREGIPAKRVLTHALTASVLEGRVGLAVMFRTVTNSWNRQLITEGWPEKGAPTQ